MGLLTIELDKYNFAPEFIPILHDKNTTKILYGSRESTKSDIGCFLKIVRCLTLPYFKCLMTRKFKEDVKGSIYETLTKVIKRLQIEHLFEFRESPLSITCKHNGNYFVALGLYEHAGKTSNAKSMNDPTDALCDELDQCTENEFEEMIFSLRGSDDLEVIGIFNTHVVDENNWIFKRWFPPIETFEKKDGSHSYIKSKRAGTTIMHSTYKMSPFVSARKKELFEDQKEHAPERYDVTGLGLIKSVKQSNMALESFDRTQHISDKVEFNKEALVYLSWDFNNLPHHTVGLWQFGGFNPIPNDYLWNLVTEFCLPNHSVKEVTKKIIDYLKNKGYESKKVVIICDFSGNKKDDHDTVDFISKIQTALKDSKFEVDNRTSFNPSVVTSLEFLDDIFKRTIRISKENPKHAGAFLKLQIHPSCSYHIADFEKTLTDKDGKILKSVVTETFMVDGQKVKRAYQARGHAVDGSRYMAVTVFKSEYQNRNKL
jgi:hypothetical protein